eukprot:gene12642-biopygen6460
MSCDPWGRPFLKSSDAVVHWLEGGPAAELWARPRAAGPPSSQCARASELFRNGRLRSAPLRASAPGCQSSSEMGA